MAIITPTSIANRLNKVVSAPAATANAGPIAGDLGGAAPVDATSSLCAIFDVTLTSGGAGDTATFVIPSKLAELSQPQPNGGVIIAAIGLHISVVPLNATAITGAPFVTQTPGTPGSITLTFAAAAAAAQYRVMIDGRHSLGR